MTILLAIALFALWVTTIVMINDLIAGTDTLSSKVYNLISGAVSIIVISYIATGGLS